MLQWPRLSAGSCAGLACAALKLVIRSTRSVVVSLRLIERLLRKWLARLPHPFDRPDRAAGYRYAASILQAESALTQVLDRPVAGRIFLEQVIRKNLDTGRPGQAAPPRLCRQRSDRAQWVESPSSAGLARLLS